MVFDIVPFLMPAGDALVGMLLLKMGEVVEDILWLDALKVGMEELLVLPENGFGVGDVP